MKRPPSADPAMNAYADWLTEHLSNLMGASERYLFMCNDPRFDVRIVGVGKRSGEALNTEIIRMMREREESRAKILQHRDSTDLPPL